MVDVRSVPEVVSSIDHLDDCVELSCPDCGGEGGHLACIEGFCTCADGDECWVDCPSCGGEG